MNVAVNVVLVHGAWSDPTIWNKIVPILEAGGKCVTTVDNQLLGLWADAASTRAAINTPLKGSHASPLSRPREVAGVILNACAS